MIDNCLEIDWDDPRNLEQVKESVRLLLHGCACKKGCTTKRCLCYKAGLKCGAGCRCANCQNFPSCRSQPSEPNNEVEQEELRQDISLRQMYNSEMVDDVDGADASR